MENESQHLSDLLQQKSDLSDRQHQLFFRYSLDKAGDRGVGAVIDIYNDLVEVYRKAASS